MGFDVIKMHRMVAGKNYFMVSRGKENREFNTDNDLRVVMGTWTGVGDLDT